MASFPSAEETLRLAAHYARLCDDELLALAAQLPELSEAAQSALADEMSKRGLKPTATLENAPPSSPAEAAADPGRAEDEDTELVQIAVVLSLRDALQLQGLLDAAGIPFVMGKENASGAEKVTSNFGNGVAVRVMRIGLPYTRGLLQDYKPEDDPDWQGVSEYNDDVPIRCPKCNSTDVIFDHLSVAQSGESANKFDWNCAACGHRWEDDGVAR